MTNKRNFELLGSFNILYIEDEADLLKHTTSVLEDFVKKIYPVQTIDEALEIIKNEKIDVIVADIHLKYSNGLDFIRMVKQELEMEIPAIVTTAFTDTNIIF